jgi:hypothetical protein
VVKGFTSDKFNFLSNGRILIKITTVGSRSAILKPFCPKYGNMRKKSSFAIKVNQNACVLDGKIWNREKERNME